MHDTKSFVLEVTEDTWRCLRELRAENEALRAVVAELRAPGPTPPAVSALPDDPTVLRRELAETRQELARQRALLAACEHDARRAVESQESLARRLEAENEVFAHRFLELEQKAEALASLYVASFRLHETLDPGEVLAIIQDIVINLVGSEELAIFEVDREHGALKLVSSRGVDPTPLRRIGLGDGAIGRAAAKGEVQMATAGDGEDVPLACVPMRLGEAVAGVIAIFRLLPQKRALGRADHELFELLGTQAAMALHCTRLHARLAHGGNA